MATMERALFTNVNILNPFLRNLTWKKIGHQFGVVDTPNWNASPMADPKPEALMAILWQQELDQRDLAVPPTVYGSKEILDFVCTHWPAPWTPIRSSKRGSEDCIRQRLEQDDQYHKIISNQPDILHCRWLIHMFFALARFHHEFYLFSSPQGCVFFPRDSGRRLHGLDRWLLSLPEITRHFEFWVWGLEAILDLIWCFCVCACVCACVCVRVCRTSTTFFGYQR